MDSRLAAWLSGIGAVLFAAAGVGLIVREVRRKERQDALRLIDTMERVILVQQNEALAWHSYVYSLRMLCSDRGINTPEPPPIADLDVGSDSLLPGIGHLSGSNRWFGRRRRRERRAADNDPVNDDTVSTDNDSGTDW